MVKSCPEPRYKIRWKRSSTGITYYLSGYTNLEGEWSKLRSDGLVLAKSEADILKEWMKRKSKLDVEIVEICN